MPPGAVVDPVDPEICFTVSQRREAKAPGHHCGVFCVASYQWPAQAGESTIVVYPETGFLGGLTLVNNFNVAFIYILLIYTNIYHSTQGSAI